MSAPTVWTCEGPYCVPDGKGDADCSACPLCNEPDDDDQYFDALYEMAGIPYIRISKTGAGQ